jgi:hypothetical protein
MKAAATAGEPAQLAAEVPTHVGQDLVTPTQSTAHTRHLVAASSEDDLQAHPGMGG